MKKIKTKKPFVFPAHIKEAKTYLEEQLCPICHEKIVQSEALTESFKNDPKTIWISNLVTHYRHNHITSWDKCWGDHGSKYRNGWFGDYEEEKRKVNERAKRQLIRKGWFVFKENGITKDTFYKLRSTSPETLTLAKQFLDL